MRCIGVLNLLAGSEHLKTRCGHAVSSGRGFEMRTLFNAGRPCGGVRQPTMRGTRDVPVRDAAGHELMQGGS